MWKETHIAKPKRGKLKLHWLYYARGGRLNEAREWRTPPLTKKNTTQVKSGFIYIESPLAKKSLNINRIRTVSFHKSLIGLWMILTCNGVRLVMVDGFTIQQLVCTVSFSWLFGLFVFQPCKSQASRRSGTKNGSRCSLNAPTPSGIHWVCNWWNLIVDNPVCHRLQSWAWPEG